MSPTIGRSTLALVLSPIRRSVPCSLFSGPSETQPEVLFYLRNILQEQKCNERLDDLVEKLLREQKKYKERLDALVEVLSSPTEISHVPIQPAVQPAFTPPTVPIQPAVQPAFTPPAIPIQPAVQPAFTPPSVPIQPAVQPGLTPLSIPEQATSQITQEDAVKDVTIFQLRAKATSEKNFAVQLLCYYVQPSELEGT